MIEKLEKIVKKLSFFRRHIKKIGLITGGVFAFLLAAASYITFKHDGRAIKGELDGRIDQGYYYALARENAEITDISQIEDLIAEVYHLNTGRRIEDDYRFTMFDEGDTPLRVMLANVFMKAHGGAGGLNWGNGDVYIKRKEFFSALRTAFHEIGHGTTHSCSEYIGKWGLFFENNEPIAEKNAIDSMISLMYLDPDLGYCVYSNFINHNFYHDSLFAASPTNKWISARNLSQIRCIECGDLEIKQSYPSNEPVERIIQERTKGKKNNELIRKIYEGTLDMFRKRFGDRPDFEEKYARLRAYIRCGITDTVYNKVFIPEDEIRARVKEKEKLLEQEHSVIIRHNLRESLLCDYRRLDDDEKAYNLTNPIIDERAEEGRFNEDDVFIILCNLDYALKKDYQDRAKELFRLLKDPNQKNKQEWIEEKIKAYGPYFD